MPRRQRHIPPIETNHFECRGVLCKSHCVKRQNANLRLSKGGSAHVYVAPLFRWQIMSEVLLKTIVATSKRQPIGLTILSLRERRAGKALRQPTFQSHCNIRTLREH
eukprot:6239605-Amphidinium_carterae.1